MVFYLFVLPEKQNFFKSHGNQGSVCRTGSDHERFPGLKFAFKGFFCEQNAVDFDGNAFRCPEESKLRAFSGGEFDSAGAGDRFFIDIKNVITQGVRTVVFGDDSRGDRPFISPCRPEIVQMILFIS